MEPLFTCAVEDSRIVWYGALAFLLPVGLALVLLPLGVDRETVLGIVLVLLLCILGAGAYLILTDSYKGRVTLFEHSLVLQSPVGPDRKLSLPAKSVRFHTWRSQNALGIGVAGDVGITAVITGDDASLKLGGRGVFDLPGASVESRSVATEPTVELKKSDFVRLMKLVMDRVRNVPH